MNLEELLEKLVSFRSLTPDDDGGLSFIEAYLSDFQATRIDVNGVKNLYLEKTYNEGVHVCFAGHIDVVPPGGEWESDPFVLTKKEGYYYGRGVSDMKGGLSAFLYTLKHTNSFNGTLSAIITSDEEGDGIYGTLEVLKYLKNNNKLPHMVIVAEPTSEQRLGDAIKVGRRGSINGILHVKGRGGHSAYPEKAISPIIHLSRLLLLLCDKELDNGDEYFAPSRLVITDVRSGYEKNNVIPSEARIMFNVRNNTLTSVQSIEAYVKKQLALVAIHDYELIVKQSSYEFITKEGFYSQQLIETLSHAITTITGETPKHSTAGGTSDARYIAQFGIDVVEFGVLNETIHAPNECIKIEDLPLLADIFRCFLTKMVQ